MDAERPHGRVDRQQLQRPARELEGDRDCGSQWRVHHAQALPRHRDQAAHRAEPVERRASAPAGDQESQHE